MLRGQLYDQAAFFLPDLPQLRLSDLNGWVLSVADHWVNKSPSPWEGDTLHSLQPEKGVCARVSCVWKVALWRASCMRAVLKHVYFDQSLLLTLCRWSSPIAKTRLILLPIFLSS